MKRIVNSREYIFRDKVRDDETALPGFLDLAKTVFGLDFTPWRADGWWGGDYIPHVLMDDEKVAANVSVNIIRACWRGASKRFIQIGTVMTDPACRGQGLARHLMEEIMARYAGQCDGMYLYANDSVLDFYPKFGFVRAEEHQYGLPVKKSGLPVRKLDMNDSHDRAKLIEAYLTRSNPYSALPVLGNTGLLMFYCGQFLKDCVYEIPELGAVTIAEHDAGQMLCYSVFGGNAPLQEVLNALAEDATRTAALGFTPLNAEGFTVEVRHEEDTTLFATGELLSLFSENQLMFPLLSHA